MKAAIYSFGTNPIVPWKQDVTLPCRSVGKPSPSVTWKQGGHIVKPPSKGTSVHSDGSLHITNLHRGDSGNYTCHVENRHGVDQITHRLTVQGKLAQQPSPKFSPKLNETELIDSISAATFAAACTNKNAQRASHLRKIAVTYQDIHMKRL